MVGMEVVCPLTHWEEPEGLEHGDRVHAREKGTGLPSRKDGKGRENDEPSFL